MPVTPVRPGRFDDEQLFYLQARGIPAEEARRLVVRGFFAELIDKIGVPALADRLTAIDRGPPHQGGRMTTADFAARLLRSRTSPRTPRCTSISVTPRSPSCNAGGEFYAIRDVCSHADVPLSEGDVEGCAIECWLHGSRFDLRTGKPTGLPAITPVPVYAVKVEGDDVLVSLTVQVPSHQESTP